MIYPGYQIRGLPVHLVYSGDIYLKNKGKIKNLFKKN
jgi:hypothetical protein